MALFKISKGLSTSLPEAITEGYCWYTYNDSKFYIDFKDENGVLSRKALNAQEAEKLTGYDIATILNSSDIEIPTSKAVIDAIEDAKTDAANKDVVVLAEAQEYTNAEVEKIRDQIDTIMNNPDTDGVINSINEFTQYIEDHGGIADGFRADIDKNKEDIAAHTAAIEELSAIPRGCAVQIITWEEND